MDITKKKVKKQNYSAFSPVKISSIDLIDCDQDGWLFRYQMLLILRFMIVELFPDLCLCQIHLHFCWRHLDLLASQQPF